MARCRGSTGGNLASLFREAPEARALATLALGVKYLKRATAAIDADVLTLNYNYAREFFCRAVGIMEQISPQNGDTGLGVGDFTRLQGYAKKSVKETAVLALNNDKYFGTMRELDQQCLEDCGCKRGGNDGCTFELVSMFILPITPQMKRINRGPTSI